MSGIDLHLHSTASDGRFSPSDIVHKSAKLGMSFISITDHDTVNGVEAALEAGREHPELTVIPGLEISTEVSGGEVHILGYFINHRDANLIAALDRMRNSRRYRAQKMIEKLHQLGIDISWERVQELAGEGSIGRPHIAQAILEKGYITSLREAFDKYLGYGKPAYVSRDKLTPVEAAQLVIKAGGLAVLAHPFTVNNLEGTLAELKASGLSGIEVYYSGYTADDISRLLLLAKEHNLAPTGGTDYHGIDDSTDIMIGSVDVPVKSVKRLMALAGHPEESLR